MIASLILALHLLGLMAATNAAYFLYICGALLLISEFAVMSFGVLALNGALAIFSAYVIQTGDNAVMGIPLDWPFLFGIAFIEILIIAAAIVVIVKLKKNTPTTGAESLIGESAIVVDWAGQEGRVRVQGEVWAARADNALDLTAKDTVTIAAIDNLTLTIHA